MRSHWDPVWSLPIDTIIILEELQAAIYPLLKGAKFEMHVPGSLKRLTEQRKCKIFVWKLNDMFNLQKSRQNATTASSLIIISL